jgi:hypothetical protein
MQDQTLRELLEKVDVEIRKTETLDQQGIELLSRLSNDIEDLLKRNSTPGESQENLSSRLAQVIEHFESSHPTLTNHLSQLSMVLSNAGI